MGGWGASHSGLFQAEHLEEEGLGEKCTTPARKQPLRVSDQVPHSSLNTNKQKHFSLTRTSKFYL